MVEPRFSLKESYRFGWSKFEKRPLFFAGFTLAFSAFLWFVPEIINWVFPSPSEPLSPIVFLFRWVLLPLAVMVTLFAFLSIHDSKSPKFPNLFFLLTGFPSFLFVYFLFFVAFVVGTMLLVVPFFFFQTQFFWAPLLVIDKRLGPIEAFKLSTKLTNGHRVDLFLWTCSFTGLLVLGLLTLIGFFIAFPVCVMAYVYVYRRFVPASEKPLQP